MVQVRYPGPLLVDEITVHVEIGESVVGAARIRAKHGQAQYMPVVSTDVEYPCKIAS